MIKKYLPKKIKNFPYENTLILKVVVKGEKASPDRLASGGESFLPKHEAAFEAGRQAFIPSIATPDGCGNRTPRGTSGTVCS